MKKKAELDLVKLMMQRNDIDVRTAAKVIEDIKVELDNQVEEKAPPIKKQFVMIVSDPSKVLKDLDLTGWVVQIPEECSPYMVTDTITKCAAEYNTTPKGRRMPVKSIGEALEVVPARIFKDLDMWVKTKEPILLISTENSLS